MRLRLFHSCRAWTEKVISFHKIKFHEMRYNASLIKTNSLVAMNSSWWIFDSIDLLIPSTKLLFTLRFQLFHLSCAISLYFYYHLKNIPMLTFALPKAVLAFLWHIRIFVCHIYTFRCASSLGVWLGSKLYLSIILIIEEELFQQLIK